jgi:hypothetical protein
MYVTSTAEAHKKLRKQRSRSWSVSADCNGVSKCSEGMAWEGRAGGGPVTRHYHVASLPAHFSGWIGRNSFYASRYPIPKEPDNELLQERMLLLPSLRSVTPSLFQRDLFRPFYLACKGRYLRMRSRQSVGKITQQVLDAHKWDAFWDAPLHVPGGEIAHHGATPPPNGIPGTNQPGLPRKKSEVHRATASYRAGGCEVKTDAERPEVSFPGVEMGIFAGRLQYTVHKGTDLLRLEVIAQTDQDSVAYKYDGGLTGITVQPGAKAAWRDTTNMWQSYELASLV